MKIPTIKIWLKKKKKKFLPPPFKNNFQKNPW